MCKFKNIIINKSCGKYCNLEYIPLVAQCFNKYFKFLLDDFSTCYTSDIYSFIENVSPYFWVVLDMNDKFMGFGFLDNFTGNKNKLYSAEISTCFARWAWGSYTRFVSKIFLKKCFDEIGLTKITAKIYPDNFRVKHLLRACGFEYEATIPNETLRFGKMQDIEVYGLYRDYYYKSR